MKKAFKRMIPFILVVVMCLCMASPAFADTATVYSVVSYKFPAQSTTSYDSAYTALIQRYMCLYNDNTRYYITSTGNIDGVFGSGTKQAVVKYQEANGYSTDGMFGAQSWPGFAGNITASETSGVYTYFKCNGDYFTNKQYVMRVANMSGLSASSNSVWYYYSSIYATNHDSSYSYLRTGISQGYN